jgi:hypothetical protein
MVLLIVFAPEKLPPTPRGDSKTMTIQSLPLQDIADKCHEHTILYYANKSYDSKWCFELFRRALALQQDDAFAHMWRIYYPQIERWVRRHPRYRSTNRPAEDFAQDAIMKFWENVRGPKYEDFPYLGALLQYLRLCVHSAICDYLKKYPDVVEYGDDVWIRIKNRLLPLNGNIDTLTILDCVQKALNDGELMEQFVLWIIYGMKPSDIVNEWSGYDNPQQISRIRQKIKRRLRNDKGLRTCLDGYLPAA